METLSQLTGFSSEERLSLQSILNSCTVPILILASGAAGVQGTGILFEHDGRLFLVTAKHILQDIALENLAVPQNPVRSHSLRLGLFSASWPQDKGMDVAVLELLDDMVCSELRKGWRVLNESNVALEPDAFSSFIVPGYPIETVQNLNGMLTPSNMTQFFTGHYTGEILGEEKGPHEFFLTYARTAKGHQGPMTPTPEVEGMSGGAIWGIGTATPGVWNPEAIVKMVGVQSAYVHERYLRATSWVPVAKALLKILKASSKPAG